MINHKFKVGDKVLWKQTPGVVKRLLTAIDEPEPDCYYYIVKFDNDIGSGTIPENQLNENKAYDWSQSKGELSQDLLLEVCKRCKEFCEIAPAVNARITEFENNMKKYIFNALKELPQDLNGLLVEPLRQEIYERLHEMSIGLSALQEEIRRLNETVS